MHQFLVTTSRGLDALLQDEINTICPGIETKLAPGMVKVTGEIADAYKVCLHSRLANRVLWVLVHAPCANELELYNAANQIDWPSHFGHEHDFMVQFNGTTKAINNTQFGALRIKDGIVDRFVEDGLMRPNVSKLAPKLVVHARLHRDEVTICVDMSGKSLHQRYYRQSTGEAPLKEHVASAMLYRSGYVQRVRENQASATPTELVMADPMCGSGTIAIEAALIAQNIAPAIKREQWGFTHWKLHKPAIWAGIVEQAKALQIPANETHVTVYANDMDRKLIRGAKANADEAGVFADIHFSQTDALKWTIDNQPTISLDIDAPTHFIVTNPPYGERLGDLATLLPMFVKWGEQLKAHFANWHVSMLTSNRELLRQLRLRSNKEYAMMNGKLECKCVNYQLNEANCTQVEQHTGQQDFANRLKKNLKRLKPFIQSEVTNCYRIYDADLPEYNCAIDRYDDWLVVQEYAPPKDIPAEKARRRLHDVLLQLPMLSGVSTDKIVLKVREQMKGKAQYEKTDSLQERIVVHENGAQFYVNLHDYLDTGLFLDHRLTRQIFGQDVQGMRVLNVFAYTGSVSVYAALGKAASVTTVDMSNTYLEWAKDNFRLNKLRGGYDFQQGDCLQWIKHHSKQYERIFIDPPSFSNSKRMSQTWDVQRDHVSLIRDALGCLVNGGKIYFSNNLRSFKLDHESLNEMGFVIEDITAATIPEDFARNSKIHHCWILTLNR